MYRKLGILDINFGKSQIWDENQYNYMSNDILLQYQYGKLVKSVSWNFFSMPQHPWAWFEEGRCQVWPGGSCLARKSRQQTASVTFKWGNIDYIPHNAASKYTDIKQHWLMKHRPADTQSGVSLMRAIIRGSLRLYSVTDTWYITMSGPGIRGVRESRAVITHNKPHSCVGLAHVGRHIF